MPKRNLLILDILRGSAALYVVAYHSIDLFTQSGRSFHIRGGALSLLSHGNPLGLLGFGSYAVLLFFVLSGFVIHLRQARRPNELNEVGKRRWVKDYCWRRGARIYPPLIVALGMTYFVGLVGNYLFPSLYGHALDHPTGSTLLAGSGSFKDMFFVLVPLKGSRSFASNGSLWSLGFEIWFYILYIPVVLIFFGRLKRSATQLLVISTLMSTALIVIQARYPSVIPGRIHGLLSVLIYFPSWVAGAVIAELYSSRVTLRRGKEVMLLGFILIAVAAKMSQNGLHPPVDALWCVGIVMILAGLVLAPDTSVPHNLIQKVAGKSAVFSYSLYLIHLPVLLFGYGALGGGIHLHASAPEIVVLFLSALIAGLVMFWGVERLSIGWASSPPWATRSKAVVIASLKV